MKTTIKKSPAKSKIEVIVKIPMVLTFHSPESPIKDKKRATVVGIFNENDSTMDIGVATCSVRDTFRKKMGKTIAEGRAQKERSRYCSIVIKDKAKVKETFYNFAAKVSNAL